MSPRGERMNEWGIVEVLVVLIGLFATVGAPIIKLISSITKLNATVDNLRENVDSVTRRNTDAHRRLWEHNEKQDAEIRDHGNRIERLEGRVDIYHGDRV